MKSKLKLAALGAASALAPVASFAEDAAINVEEQLGVVEGAVTTAGTIAAGVLALGLTLFAVGYVVRMIRKAGRAG